MTKSREVAVVLSNKGMERGVTMLMTELFERIAACEQNVREMGAIQLKGLQQLAQVVDGAGRIRQEVERMQRSARASDDDDLPPRAS